MSLSGIDHAGDKIKGDCMAAVFGDIPMLCIRPFFAHRDRKMPVRIKKIGGGMARVSTPGGVKAKKTTLRNAYAQKRLLNAIDHGWKPTGKRRKKKYAPR
jgi:hypothetical protein